MSSPRWQRLPASLPVDQDTVWIRGTFPQNAPWLAMWDYATQSFIEPGANLVLPWYMCYGWRVQ